MAFGNGSQLATSNQQKPRCFTPKFSHWCLLTDLKQMGGAEAALAGSSINVNKNTAF